MQVLLNVEIALPSKHLSNIWRALEMLPINCKITSVRFNKNQ